MDQLLERDAELDSLVATVEGLADGRGAVELVRGEAGIGKTSLVRALRDRVPSPFHVGRCEPLSVPEPLGPIRELSASVAAADFPELATDDRRALARRLQSALTARGPAVAVIEDAHWADPASLDLVRILARRAEDAPLALIVTLRDDELAANPALATLVGDLAGDPAVRQMRLRPLSHEAIASLAAASSLDPGQLARVTGGNPFLVAETIAAGTALPDSVREATLARVSRLGAQARGVVDIAAVAGHRVRFELLAALAPGCEPAVEEALAHGVLTDDGETLGFRHELTRQAIERALSTPRRKALHGDVAEAMAAQRPIDHARVAHHADAAGLDRIAASHAAAAAAEAEALGALLEAGLQLERALRLSSDLPREARIDLLIRYARSINFAGRDLEPSRAAAEEAVELSDQIGDRAAGGRARAVLSAALWSLDRVEEARVAAAESVSLLEGAGDLAELARAHAALIRIESISFNPADAIARGPVALAVAADARLDEARIDTLISLGLAHGHRGEAEATPMLAEARSQASERGTAIQVIRAHVNAVSVAADARDGAVADAVFRDAVTRFEDFETAIPRQYVLVLHARSLLDRGRYAEALDEIAQGRGDWHGGLVVADGVEALLRARLGEGDPGAQLDAALAEIGRLSPGWRHLFLRAARAEVAWIAGDLARARTEAGLGLDAPYATQLVRPAADALLWAARSGSSIAWPPAAPPLPEPARLELAGDWRAAAVEWHKLDAPYEAALAALPGDDHAARDAIASLRRLGAVGASRAFARDRAARGGTSLRGPHRATLANAAGLTRREQQVLSVLAGGATNSQIAAALHLSERTVAHHVSAILGKLRAPTRTAAVQAAIATGLLGAKDGPPAAQT